MATYAPQVLEWLADEWEKAIPSAECSGIVNDSGDRGKTSKHWSRQDNPSGSWAVTHSKDKQGPSNMSCAIDMSMNEADMKLVHGRFRSLYNARASDPRAGYVDCFNGWDGNGSPGRYDLPAGTISTTDDSHKWHEHVESFYLYVGTDEQSWKAARAILSVVKGETAQQWLAAEEGDMADYTEAQMKAFPWQYVGGGIPAGMSTLGVLNYLYNTVTALSTQLAELREQVDQLLATAGGNVDVAAVVAALEPIIRDAVADLGEGGAVKVRGPQD
jgi:hypothetical protein